MDKKTRNFGLKGPDPHPEKDKKFKPTVAVHSLPSSLSYDNMFGPIDDQGQVGTCVAFGCGTTFEAYYHKRNGTNYIISKRALYSLTKHLEEPGGISDPINDQGTYVNDALQILTSVGVVPDAKWPYGNADPNSIIVKVPATIIDKTHDIKGFERVVVDVNDIKLALYQRGPVVIGSNWYDEWMMPSLDPTNAGLLQWPVNLVTNPEGHCTVIVGYSDSRKAFRGRNQWTSDWGDAGHYWLPYAAVGEINDAYTVSAPTL